jgi:carboxyl-terminal processing protease
MRRTFLAAVLLWACVISFLSGAAWGQSTATSIGSAAASAGGTAEWLRRGNLLESEHRWGEALTHYEDAMRQHPGDGSVKRRFEFARLHYELCRRYNDRSFRDAVGQMSAADALSVYDEVLLKIQGHYVDAPKWKEMVESGTHALEVALSERIFLDATGRTLNADSIEGFRTELRRAMAEQAIAARENARQAVAAAADLAERRLGVSASSVVLEYACGAMMYLDQYSCFLTPDQLKEVYSQIKGTFVGLGVELKAQEGVLVIVRVIPNSPAKKAGVRDGDRILGVDGQSTETMSTDQAANLLQGQEGTTAQLVLASPNEPAREVSVKRQRVDVPSVDDVRMEDPANGVAYLKLVCFQETTQRDLDTALWTLHRAGMKKLIMDLRGNPGGLLISAVDAADLFLERGVIVSTHGRNVYEDGTYTAREPGTWRVPLVVLIDQDSASAAEIFAGAVRDHKRGTVVGRRSYGKGSVQAIFPLTHSGAGLRLTTAKFFSPNGHPFTGIGVEPDIVVHQTAKPIVQGQTASLGDRDPILAAGLQAILQPASPVAQR